MRIRGYRPDDLDAMCRLDIECFSGDFQFDRETMREAVETPSALIVIAETGKPTGELLGFIIVHAQGRGRDRQGYIVTVDVAQASRRTGVGASLLREAEAQALAVGLRSMALHVAVENHAAVAFYERENYRPTGLVKGYYQQAGCDALTYAKQL